ncbi:enoyl-CoA hydratase-related protein [Paenibacillus harenae]|uniref:enoyl-CoA hydratase-related protein n=1 Tax=Paenibacillus harenae TaxID=306543 RepID=UPI0027D9273D|nr:enoyl-CoA hydratase-related protein [Paenibacillus harenae]
MENCVLKSPLSKGIMRLTFNRKSHRNAINSQLLHELNEALDEAERDSACSIVILEGQDGVFCTGMDLKEAMYFDDQTALNPMSMQYMRTLKRFASTRLIIIASVDGQVIAGGVGFCAASDLVIATPRSQFSLSEAIWGLLPAMVLPYLIRRTGFQPAYRMTLTTMALTAEEARLVRLVDELDEQPERWIRKWSQSLERVTPSTVGHIKGYFRKIGMITDEMERLAVEEISRLVTLPEVKSNIENFLEHQRFPWNK